MNKPIFTKIIALMMVFSVAFISCSKDDDGGEEVIDPTEEKLPANKQEAETKIKGKWNIAASGEVRSVEFLDGDTYVLEVASSALASRKSALSARTKLSSFSGGLKAENAGNTSTQKIYGTFTISADGKTITLDEIARITISGISETSFSFTIIFTDGDKDYAVSATIVTAIDSSSKTSLLARNWGSSTWMYYEPAVIQILTSRGFKPQDEGFMFTEAGTMIMRYINFEQSSSIDPETGQSSNVITNISLGADVYSWKWKDSQQTVITASRDGDSFDITITELTASKLNARLANGNSWVLTAL